MSPARLLASWTGSSAEPAERRTFSDRLNLNRMRFEKLRAVTDRAVNERQLQILQSMFGKSRFEVFIWEEDSGSIPDTEELKLVVLAKEDPYHIRDIVRNCGIRRRANRNTLFFLYPSELVRRACINTIRYALACEALASDGTLSLSEEARREVAEETVKQGAATWDSVRKLYRALGIPGLEQRRTIDLGIPPHGSRRIDEQVYGRLVSDGLVLEYVDPLMMRDEHLKDEAFILTEELYRSFLRIPGKPRLANRTVLEVAISRGVETGVFGLGQLVGAQPLCRAFMERPSEVTLRGREVIMREGLCKPVAIR